jgi:hypothetical protein
MTDVLAWRLQAGEIPKEGRRIELVATPAERAAIAQTLDLVGCRKLAVAVSVRPLAGARFLVSGTLAAEVEQRCVVTLEPVGAAIEQELAVEFWPAEEVEAAASGAFDALGGDDPEPIENGALAIGRLAYELLASSLDPYPRRPGAEFAWKDEAAGGETRGPGPFAQLARLKTDERS